MPVLSSMRTFAQVFALLVFIVVLATIGSLLFATHFVTGTITYVVDSLAARSGLSPFLVRAVVIVSTIPFFWAVARFTRNVLGLLNLGWSPLSLYSNIYGIIIVLYIAVFFFAMYWSSRDAYAYKYCADTSEGIFVSDGTAKDPVYGVESKPCSLLQIKELRNGKGNLQAPVEIRILEADHYPWFDGVTGRPRVWFALDPDGNYRFYDHPGNDPHSGQPLEAIRQDIIQRLKQTEAAELAGKKQTSDAQVAAAKEEERRIHRLCSFLSFCRGGWVSTAVATGLDETGELAVAEWGTGQVSPASDSISGWLDKIQGGEMSILYPAFCTRMADESFAETFGIVMYWYIRSDTNNVGPDGGLILLQTALERIAWHVLVHERRAMNAEGFGRLTASDQLRLLLTMLSIPTQIPVQLEAISALGRSNAADGPQCLTLIRNSLVHPPRKPTGHKTYPYYEAYTLAKWYLELILLRSFGYEGKYSNRTNRRWTGELEPVPWAKG